MDERSTILPPPPPATVALWAMLNAFWYRLARAVSRRLHPPVRATRRVPIFFAPAPAVPIGMLASRARLRTTVPLDGTSRPTRPDRTPYEDRPTTVERRRS